MNYKKILKSRRLRLRILKALSMVPDKSMLKIQYKLQLGRWPDFKTPKRFTEKIQLYKMHYRNPLMHICVDKYKVRDFIEKKGLGNYLVKLYGVYDDARNIDFNQLPERFVIKTNDGGGGNNIIICKNKSQLNIEDTINKVNSWLDVKSINPGREWAYTGIDRSRIIVEEFLENTSDPEVGVSDYKIFCFNGKPKYIFFDGERYILHKRNIYDIEWNDLHIATDCENFKKEIPKPKNLDLMLEIAGILSEDFPFMRVDLYNIDGKIYFGELTFYPLSGYIPFSRDDFDFELGRLFDYYPRN